MITKQDLQAAGYEKYQAIVLTAENYYETSYQKKIRDEEGGVSYFVNFHFYETSKIKEIPISVGSECQFQRKNGQETVDVHYHVRSDSTLEQIEQFYLEFFTKMNCDRSN